MNPCFCPQAFLLQRQIESLQDMAACAEVGGGAMIRMRRLIGEEQFWRNVDAGLYDMTRAQAEAWIEYAEEIEAGKGFAE